jgi:hypothetical protein
VFAPIELSSTSNTALLTGTATPGAVVRVLDRQTVADNRGGWGITVDLVPGANHFQAVATELSGLSLATNFTVIYTPPAATASNTTAIATETSAGSPSTIAHSSTTVAVNVPVAILSPLDGAVVTTRRITVSGTATPGARVNTAGTVVTATKKGLWSVLVTLKPGENPVSVTANTQAGVTTASITVRYDVPPTTTTSAGTVPPVDTSAPPPTEPPTTAGPDATP